MVAAAAAEETCVPGPGALGVSRVLEIDTSGGPRFGFQYKEPDLLQPGEVVLTFDDGPLPAYTRVILDALAAHCTKATFFSVGRMAVAYPEMVQEYARRGHTVATHTWSHQNLRSLSPGRARAEIELGFSAVQQALGRPVAPFFRFPYLADSGPSTALLKERNIAIFSIDVDSKDFATRDPGSVHRRVMATLARTGKGIILFHDIHASTARALPGLLAELKAKGYRVVHLQPKAEAITVAEFDALARQEQDKRRSAAAGQPLARRALTWPAVATEARPVVVKAPAQSKVRRARQPKSDWLTNALRW
jgi:peptidoglycan/xylan/chitin deacetylase (PgdA/CDA1 family)